MRVDILDNANGLELISSGLEAAENQLTTRHPLGQELMHKGSDRKPVPLDGIPPLPAWLIEACERGAKTDFPSQGHYTIQTLAWYQSYSDYGRNTGEYISTSMECATMLVTCI